LVSRPCIFTVFNLNKVYLPHVDNELVNSAFISEGLILAILAILSLPPPLAKESVCKATGRATKSTNKAEI